MKLTTFDRFSIGFCSALCVPIIKCAQNSLDVGAAYDAAIIIGAVSPIVLLGSLIGAYAIFIEKSETDAKRLFRVCVSLPALLVSLAAGKDPGVAIAIERPSVERKCDPVNPFVQGAQAMYDSLSNQRRANFWVLSREEHANEHITIGEIKYYIVKKLMTARMGQVLYDVNRCEFVKLNPKTN